eukprot:3240767-Rhodomonas_salina.1
MGSRDELEATRRSHLYLQKRPTSYFVTDSSPSTASPTPSTRLPPSIGPGSLPALMYSPYPTAHSIPPRPECYRSLLPPSSQASIASTIPAIRAPSHHADARQSPPDRSPIPHRLEEACGG